MDSLTHAGQNLSAAKCRAIMDRLRLQALSERFESITEAEERTFSWLLTDEEDSDQNPPSTSVHRLAKESLLRWIEQGEGFYYISGKPGAGKSTLMKLICNHASFLQRATAWAAGSVLVTGRFFFWKPGHAEQKTIAGLLRGLLCSMLECEPSLVPVAFPELWDGSEQIDTAALEHRHVETAFHHILETASTTGRYKILLTIDGLDEFDGDHADLLELMRSWVSKYPSIIKICVSSREYGIFEDFFLESPKMRLHELTRGDMAELISSRLKPNRLFSSLAEEQRSSITQLITERAEGVFLWVVMVVAAMDEAVVSGAITNSSELERSINDCPSELDDLLPHLLSSVSVHSRPWAYKAISLVKYAQFTVPELLQSSSTAPGVGLLDLMLLDEASPSWNLSAFQPRSDTNSANLKTRVEAARAKIMGRCKAFLNVITISEASTWPANGDERMYVAVTHRSVVEFLSSDQARGIMALYLTHFSAFFALCSTMLACLRFLEPSNYPLLQVSGDLDLAKNEGAGSGLGLEDVLAPSLQGHWRELIRCAVLTGQADSPRFFSLLDEIGDAVKRHLALQLSVRRIKLCPSKASPHQLLSAMAVENGVSGYSAWRQRLGGGVNGRRPI